MICLASVDPSVIDASGPCLHVRQARVISEDGPLPRYRGSRGFPDWAVVGVFRTGGIGFSVGVFPDRSGFPPLGIYFLTRANRTRLPPRRAMFSGGVLRATAAITDASSIVLIRRHSWEPSD